MNSDLQCECRETPALSVCLLKSHFFPPLLLSVSLQGPRTEPWFIQDFQLWNSCRSLDALTRLPALLSYLWVDKRLNPKFPIVKHAIRMLAVESISSRGTSSNFLLLFNQDFSEEYSGCALQVINVSVGFDSLARFCSQRRAAEETQAHSHGIVCCNHRQSCLFTVWFKVNPVGLQDYTK